MELVVVVAIIVLLAGLTLAGIGFVNGKNAREKAKVQVKLIENALEAYHGDNRTYPPSLDPSGERGDEVLFKYLYYDGYEAHEAGNNTATVYLPEFDPENNSKSGQAWIEGKGQQARIIDPWAHYYRYRSGEAPDAVNPDFDIWSCGPDGKTNSDPKHKDCLDDIRNF